MPSDRIRQHRSLTNQKLPTAVCIKPDCCSSDFVATNRIDGRMTASQIAAASLASFLLRFK
jgi:hypothetical protein